MAWVNSGSAMMKGYVVSNAQLEADRIAALAQRDADEDAEKKKRNQAATFEAEKKKKKEEKEEEELAARRFKIQKEFEKREAAKEENRTRDATNGNWHPHFFPLEYGDNGPRSPRMRPPSVLKIVLSFLQRWCTVHGLKLVECKTIQDLRHAFYRHFMPWIFANFQSDGHEAEAFVYGNRSCDLSFEEAYLRLQEWVMSQKGQDNPYKKYRIYNPAKNITFENVLYAMSTKSGTFEGGLLKIHGFYKNDASPIEWQVEMPYVSTRFVDPPLTDVQKKRLQESYSDDDWPMY